MTVYLLFDDSHTDVIAVFDDYDEAVVWRENWQGSTIEEFEVKS